MIVAYCCTTVAHKAYFLSNFFQFSAHGEGNPTWTPPAAAILVIRFRPSTFLRGAALVNIYSLQPLGDVLCPKLRLNDKFDTADVIAGAATAASK